jgi:hypothetical protein
MMRDEYDYHGLTRRDDRPAPTTADLLTTIRWFGGALVAIALTNLWLTFALFGRLP